LEQWHPILAAVEGPTGTWRLVDGLDKPYGTIEIRRVMNGTDTRYRVMFRGDVIGWAMTLRIACEQAHAAFLRAHGPGGGPIAGWGERPAPRAAEPR
jgi:hypothetical protein